MSIKGGSIDSIGNPFDPQDEGIFISKVLCTVCTCTCMVMYMYMYGDLQCKCTCTVACVHIYM